MGHHAFSGRLFTSLVAVLLPVAGLASTSCASPRLPTGGYPLRAAAAGYEVQVLVDGAPARTFDHDGESFVMGQMGARYTLRVVNHTGRRIEAVVSVDGRDAIDGKTADVRTKRGYLVPAWGTVDIDGWRLSQAEVAAFRFATVADSYAARTGSARDVGVIGVAVFPERYVAPRPVYVPQPRYPEWRYRDDGLGYGGHVDSDKADTYAEQEAPRKSTSKGAGSASGGRAAAEPAPPASAMADAESSGAPAPSRRPGLGTEFGEAVSSPVREVGFTRASATRPSVVLGVRYNDRDGLVALGIDIDGCCAGPDDLAWRQSATPFPGSDRDHPGTLGGFPAPPATSALGRAERAQRDHYAAPPAGWRDGCCVRY